MASILRYLFGNFLLCRMGPEPNLHESTDDPIIETLHFVIPPEDFEKFIRMKPEDEFLNVSQYMFLYRYTKNVEQINAPGPDYDRASYLFGDGMVTYLLKGWVPTKATPKIDKVGDVFSRLLEAQSCKVHAGIPRRKSAYNWGIINNWSRHCADTSEDNVPIQLFSLTRPTVFNSDFISYESSPKYSQDTQESDRRNINQADDTASRRVGSCVVMTSTFNTRDRRLRPKAAKGRRTRHY